MTRWLEYFTNGLATQMEELQEKGKKLILVDVLVQKYRLSKSQKRALAQVMNGGEITIHQYQSFCPEVSRRTLQRELKEMVDCGLFLQVGSTNKFFYRLNITLP